MMTRLLPLAFLLIRAADPIVAIAPDAESGVYEPGKTVTWTVRVTQDGAAAAGKIAYAVKTGGLAEATKGELDLVDGKATVTATRAMPGTLLLEVKYRAAKEVVAYGGAAFAPEKIAPSAPPPDDFDAFWKAKLDELGTVPMNPTLTAVDVGDPSVDYFRITLDHFRGAKIQGQLALPKGKTALPAMLQVQWAGVYPLHRDWVLGFARGGWLAMNIQAHDLPIDEPADFYKEKAGKDLADYTMMGGDDREKSYFLRMFLSCHRAVQYLTERPEWGKKSMVVQGGSQGGWQAIVAAGLHPAVTALAANVPAGCDHTGRKAGRAPGWPGFGNRTWMKDVEKRVETGRYFDAMNFASRIKCPALVGIGLVDTVCPPEGIYATVNRLGGPKKIVLMPKAGHGGEANAHQAYYAAWGPFLEEHKR